MNYGSAENDHLTRGHSGRQLGGYDLKKKKASMLEQQSTFSNFAKGQNRGRSDLSACWELSHMDFWGREWNCSQVNLGWQQLIAGALDQYCPPQCLGFLNPHVEILSGSCLRLSLGTSYSFPLLSPLERKSRDQTPRFIEPVGTTSSKGERWTILS